MRERKLPYQLKKHLSAWRYNLDNWFLILYEPNRRFIIGHRYTTQTQTFEYVDGKWCRKKEGYL